MTTVFCWRDFEYCPCGSGVFKCVYDLVGLIFLVQLFPFLVGLFFCACMSVLCLVLRERRTFGYFLVNVQG